MSHLDKRWWVALLLAAGCGGGGGDLDAAANADASTSGDAHHDAASPDAATNADATPADAGGSSDATADGSWNGHLGAEVTCSASGDPCASLATDPAIYASYRKDHYLDEAIYPEASLEWAPEPPVDGGRLHVTSIATASGAVTDVRIDGESVADLVSGGGGTPQIEWYHVWPDPVVAGAPVWVAFHSRSAEWDQPGASASIEVITAGGTALDGLFDVAQSKAPLTYVTPTDDLSTLVIHARNTDTVSHTLNRLLVNGRDVLAAGIACVPKVEIAPGETVMWTVPLCGAAALGDPWTVVADWEGTPAATAGGRFLRPQFPIETWPTSSDCPLPGGNESWLDQHFAAGFDTFYTYWGQGCSDYSTQEIVNLYGPTLDHDFRVLIGDDFEQVIDDGTTGLITDYHSVAGMLTGDESDGEIYDQNGDPAAEIKARQARWMWRNYPEVTIYNGAKTNKNIGTFAGMTDIQGIDLYVAACAPWICTLGPPPIRAAYDYLRNARDNHMPWPTWQYAQGLGNWAGQPNAAEVLVQAFSVMAAGGKGLMWFQSRQDDAGNAPQTWAAMAQANWVFRGVRDRLRVGDVTDAATATGDILIEMIRAPDALIAVLIDIGSTAGPDLISCGIASIGGPVPHWALTDQQVAVSLAIPDDFPVVDGFEITVDDSGPQIVDIPYDATIAGRQVTYHQVPLSAAVPVRVLVLAASDAVRDQMAAAMAH